MTVIELLRSAPFGLRVAMQNAEALAQRHFRTFAVCEAAADWLEAHPDGDLDDPDTEHPAPPPLGIVMPEDGDA